MASVDLQEKVNFTRLSRLLVDKGTEALRNTFGGIHPPASLPAVLNANKTHLIKLKPRVINNSQWNLLYPPSGDPPEYKTFDVTLLTVLFRNICGFPKTGWSVMPVDTDRSTQANIVRIKSFRNEVYAHVTSTQVDNTTFESLWQKISQALIELNIPQNDVDDLKICPFALKEEMYIRVLRDWKLREEECIVQEEEVLKQLTHLQQIAEESRDGINKILTLQDKKELSESPQRRLSQVPGDDSPEKERCKQDDEHQLRKLAKFNFKTKIKRKVELFMPQTRKWLLKKVDDWFLGKKNESGIVLKAGPGFGKSVFAAKLCDDFKKNGKLAACHFCDFSDSNLRNPRMMLQSLASQMCENIHGFKEKLLDQLKRPHEVSSLKDAFGVYLQNPLDELEIDEQEPLLILIDGLDESAVDDKNDVVKLIANHFLDLPDCVKVLVTSRPEISLEKLKGIHEINIGNDDADNNADLSIYLRYSLPGIGQKNENCYSTVLEQLVATCEGSFLYAFHIQCELKKHDNLKKMKFQEIVNVVPKGLDSVYQTYFQRLEDELSKALRVNVDVTKLLELFVAAKGPLPLTFFTRTLGLAPDSRPTKISIQKVNVAISCLLYVSGDLVTVFHKSVIDWLLGKGYEDHQYAVKISNGDKLLWQICEKVFEEIKRVVCSGHELDFNNDVKYALRYGFVHLLACDMKKCLYWLVDVVIIHAMFSESPERAIVNVLEWNLWEDSLRFGAVESDELRARIAWHIVEIESILSHTRNAPLSSCYLENVLARSPEGCFSDDEKDIAKSLLSKTTMFVELVYDEVEVIPHAIWCSRTALSWIVAVGMSKDKTIVALAQMDGTITVLSLPSLVELWQYSTEYRVTCCTFAADDSFVLFGKLETKLSIAKKMEIPFFHGNQEVFQSCAFSPNGKRLATCDCSKAIKLWDVGEQNMLSLIYHEVAVTWCSFDSTGLLIVGGCDAKIFYNEDRNSEDEEHQHHEGEEDLDSFSVWNAVTLQRCDMRPLPEREFKSGKTFHGQLCRSNFRPGLKNPPTYKIPMVDPYVPLQSKPIEDLTWSTGMYNGVECIFVLGNRSVSVIENNHFTTLAVWNFYSGSAYTSDTIFPEMKAIEDDRWLYASTKNVIVFGTSPLAVCPTRVLSCSFSPDGSKLATCTSDGCINIWNVHTGKVEQRSKHGEGNSSFACWWSEKFFFVFEFVDKIPRLSKYSVDVNLRILLFQSQEVPLCHLANELMSQLSVVSFAEGFLCFDCGKTKPVEIVDVSKDVGPQMVTLPGIEPQMSITVSPGASFIVGGKGKFTCSRFRDTIRYHIWKRNTLKPAVYELHNTYVINYPHTVQDVISCFTNDCEVVVIASEQFPGRISWRIYDLITGVHRDVCSPVQLPISKLFYLNNDKVFIAASREFITFLAIESGAVLGHSFQPYLDGDFLKQTKLSPNGTVIAYPRVNGDVKFLRVFRRRLATNTGPNA